MLDNISWLEPWDELCTEPVSFENELYKEVGEYHILYGKKVTAVGRRYDCDDFLFKIHDSEFEYAVVHLTYSSKREGNPKFPRTKVFRDINDWIERCMIPDHSEYTVGEED
jgi:hypothetical protein